MYTILFIDEEKEVFEDFLNYVEENDTDKKFDILTEYPINNLNEMIEKIIDLNPDVIITDFNLNEIKTDIHYTVPYNGVVLMETFLSIRENFPFFVMTSFDNDAILISKDVNKVYIKEILHDSSLEKRAKANFLERVEKQIQHYYAEITKSEERLKELLNLRKEEKTTLKEEEEIIILDTFLEKSINGREAIPQNLKERRNEKYLQDLLNKADLLIDKFENKND